MAVARRLAGLGADLFVTSWTATTGTSPGVPTPAAREPLARLFPAGRWGTPEDAARPVAWLCTDEAAWITGQVINSEGGFRRSG
jgi:3-oxoacyl-[acyl-carrier protein] reductase